MRRRPPTRTSLATVPVLALAVAAAGCASAVAASVPAPHARTPPAVSEVTLTQGAAVPGVKVAMPAVGLSMEYPVMAQDLGGGACPPAALVSALEQLGSPPLSLAGDSQDMTVPEGALVAPTVSWETATLYTLPASFWSQLHCLLSATRDPLTVGLNLKTGEPAWASEMVAGAQSAATNGLYFSLGNEPDLYKLPNYSALAHTQPNEEALEAGLYLQLASALEPLLGGAPVIGPELAAPTHWQHELGHVIVALHLSTVGVHAYPLSACPTPAGATVSGLLTSYAADEPQKMASVVTTARAAGLPAIISESNSVSCGGVAGVSDTPAAAVWAVRFVLSALKTGFQEVRFHFAGDPYDPFIVRGGEVIKRPLDDALVALNQWLPVGASLRTVTGVHGLVATNVTGTSGQPLLILDNEHPQAQKVVVRKATALRTETITATAAGVQQRATLSPVHGKFKLTVPANSVMAVAAG